MSSVRGAVVAARRRLCTRAPARPYEDIPGPKAYPLVGNKFRFLPPFRKYDMTNLLTMNKQLLDEFGEIVRFSGLEPRRDLLFVFRPEDMETVFRHDGPAPQRPSFNSLLYFRQLRHEIFRGASGVLVDQGAAWQEARSHVNPIMMKTQLVHQYTPKIGQVAQDFVDSIPGLRDANNEMPADFKNEIHKWALESIALVALDARLGCLERDLAPDSVPQQMIDAVHVLVRCLHVLEIGNANLWKFIPTPTLRKFVRTLDFFTEASLRYVNEGIARARSRRHLHDDELSVLERFLKRDPHPARSVVMALDMLMVGVDTTSHALTNVLLHLSENEQKQQKLFEELRRVLPRPDAPITPEMLEQMKFMRACIRESLRLKPVITANARTTSTEIVLSDYRVPKGVDVIMPWGLISRSDKHYREPLEFVPERWMRGGAQREAVNPFVTLPFGHGARKCIGMRFAMLELELVTAKLVRRFAWKYNYGEMKYRSYFLHVPMDPLKFQVTERPD